MITEFKFLIFALAGLGVFVCILVLLGLAAVGLMVLRAVVTSFRMGPFRLLQPIAATFPREPGQHSPETSWGKSEGGQKGA